MGEYADMEIERQQQAFADREIAKHEVEIRRVKEVRAAQTALQKFGLHLVQKTAFHFHITKAGKVIAQWWPTRGQTMLGQEKGPTCKTAAELETWLRWRWLVGP